MKFLLFTIGFLTSISSFAQVPTNTSVVKDSSGKVYSTTAWRQLLMYGGYDVRPVNIGQANTEFYLVRLNYEEKQTRFGKMPAPKESPFFKTGNKLKIGVVRDTNGNKIDLKESKGQITIINFWFINCPPCRMEIPELNLLAEKYASDSIRFIAIALDQKKELEAFLKTTSFNYQHVDNGRSISQIEGVSAYPTHVVLDGEGRVYFHTSGLSSNTVYWLEKSIRELQNKTSIQPSAVQ